MRTKHRSLLAILLLNIITFGLYQIYWYFITKTEMNTVNGRDYKVPFFLWFFVPIINIWWFWRFAKAIEKSTHGKVGRWAAFFAPVVLGFLGAIALALLYPFIGSPQGYQTSFLGSLTITLVILLPIFYFQSNLNKYAK